MSESGEREAKECWHEPWVLLPGSAGLFQWNVPLCIKQQSKKSRLAATPLLHTLLDTQERRQSEREQNDKQPPRKDRAHNNRDPWCVSPFTRGEKEGSGGEGRGGRAESKREMLETQGRRARCYCVPGAQHGNVFPPLQPGPVISPSSLTLQTPCTSTITKVAGWHTFTLTETGGEWYYTSETRNKKAGWKTVGEQYSHCQLPLSFLGRGLTLTTLDTFKLSLLPSPPSLTFLHASLTSPGSLPLFPFTLLFTHPDSTLLLCSFHLSFLLLHISLSFSYHLLLISHPSHLLFSLPSIVPPLFPTSSQLLPITTSPPFPSPPCLSLLSSLCQFKQTMLSEWQNLLILRVTAA